MIKHQQRVYTVCWTPKEVCQASNEAGHTTCGPTESKSKRTEWTQWKVSERPAVILLPAHLYLVILWHSWFCSHSYTRCNILKHPSVQSTAALTDTVRTVSVLRSSCSFGSTAPREFKEEEADKLFIRLTDTEVQYSKQTPWNRLLFSHTGAVVDWGTAMLCSTGWPLKSRLKYCDCVMEYRTNNHGPRIWWSNTLYEQMYLATPVNYWIQGFQSDPLPQLYRVKHLATQPPRLWCKTGHSEELSDFKRG